MTTIGRSKRKFLQQSFNKTVLPGVGAYNVETQEEAKSRGNSFTKAKRQLTQDQIVDKRRYRQRKSFLEGQPGPGSYSLELRREKNVVSFTHSKRFITDTQGIPGPGAYKTQDSLKDRIKAGSISRSSRQRVAPELSRPGPSDYDIPSIIKYKKKQPAILIGRAERILHAIEDNPGPGAYNLSKEKHMLERMRPYETFHSRKESGYGSVWHSKKLDRQMRATRSEFVD